MRNTVILTAAASVAALGLSLGGGIVPAGAAEMVDGPEVHWKLSLWGKRRAVTEGMEYMSEEVAKRTGGKFTLKLYYGEQLSKSKENLDGIKLGAFEAAHVCASYHPGKNAPLNVLDLPFLPLQDLEVMRVVHETVYAHPDAKQALAKWNGFPFYSTILPQYEYMGRGPAPQSVKDFEGKRLRALGGMGRAAEAIGATPSTMPASETYTALQRGTVDAIGFPYSYTFAAYKLDEIADWVTTNMKLGTVNCPMVVNLDAWAKLPAQYKQLLESLKPRAYDIVAAAYAKKDKELEAKWSGSGKPKMVQIPESQMTEFRRIAGEPIWTTWVEENKGEFDAQGLLDLVLMTAKKASMK